MDSTFEKGVMIYDYLESKLLDAYPEGIDLREVHKIKMALGLYREMLEQLNNY